MNTDQVHTLGTNYPLPALPKCLIMLVSANDVHNFALALGSSRLEVDLD